VKVPLKGAPPERNGHEVRYGTVQWRGVE
jgi:hypothetical protein